MSKFIYLVDMIKERGENSSDMQELTEILQEMFSHLEEKEPDLYKETIHQIEGLAYKINKKEAEEIVHKMKPYGEKWDYETVKEYLGRKGIDNHCAQYYMTMNMAYNDYHGLGVMVGKEEDPDFYFEIAKEFICDEDAKPYKVEKYFLNM